MNKYYPIIVSFLFIIFLAGCNNTDPASTGGDLELSEVVEEQAAFGLELNDIISTSQEIEDMTHEPSLIPEVEIETYSSLLKTNKLALDLLVQSNDHLPSQIFLAKPNSDTLLFYTDNTVLGVRSAIYYDGSTGLVRAYTTKYKFAAWQKMTYDSVEIILDLNFTLDDDSDDMLESVYRQQIFDPNFFVQNIVSQIIVTAFSEKDITGLEATIDSYYKEGRYLSHLKQSIDIEPDETGTLREDFNFKDGTSSFHAVTFHGDHNGSFARQLRDGTMITGTFNDVNDDHKGSFYETIDFPVGRYVDKISKSAQVSIILPDSIFNASLSRAVYFASGRIDSAHVDITVQENDGLKTTELDITKGNGAHGSFIVEETSDMAVLEGLWTTWNEYFISVSAEYYSDGSGHIHYEVYEPPYQQGNSPIIVVDYYISPDGSGNGTIVHDGNTYQVSFNSLDEAEIRLGEKSRIVNMYR